MAEHPQRRPAGKREEASVLGVAAALASWLGPRAEEWSPGAGQAVTIFTMAAIPFIAKVVRDRLGKTLGQAIKAEGVKARDVLIVLLVAAGVGLGCVPFRASVPVQGSSRDIKVTGWPVGDARICIQQPDQGPQEPAEPGQSEDYCTSPAIAIRGGHMGKDFGDLIRSLGSIVGSVFGGTRADSPAPTIIIQGADVTTATVP